MPRYTEADLRGARLLWVLTLRIGGVDYVVGEAAMRVPHGAASVRVAPGLGEPSCGVEAQPDQRRGGEVSASLQVQLAAADPTGEAWRAFRSPGRVVEGELALLREGDDWTQREKVVDGLVVADRFGAPSEPVRCVVREALAQGAGVVLGGNAVASEATWPASGTLAVDEQAQGAVYPVVFGSPGRPRGDEESDVVPAVPALLVVMSFGSPSDNQTQDAVVMVTGHEAHGADSGSDTVRIFNMSRHEPNTPQKFWWDFPVDSQRDAEGRLVGTATLTAPGSSAGSLIVEGGAEVYAAFLDGGGGVTDGGELVRGAGDVVRWLMGRSTLRLAPLAPTARAALNHYKIDGYVNTDPLVRDVILGDLLPLLPATLLPGPEGWELQWWNLRATRADAVRTLNVQRDGLDRVGDVQRPDPGRVVNRVAIEFAPRADTGAFTRRLEYGPAADTAATGVRRYERHLVAEQSARVHGERGGQPLRTPMVWDPTTAGRILADKLLLGALRPMMLTYEGPQWVQAYRPGQVVVLQDSELELDMPAWVVGVSRGPGRQRIRLRELPSHLLE